MPVRPRTVSGRLISLGAPTKHRRHCSMPQSLRHRHGPKPDRRRALELLVSCPDGCTEALMIARRDGRLIRSGLATATTERVVAPGMHGRTDARADHLAPSLARRY